MVEGTPAPTAHRRVDVHEATITELLDARHYAIEIHCPSCGRYLNGVPQVEDTHETRTLCAHCKQEFVWYVLAREVRYVYRQATTAMRGKPPVSRQRLQNLPI
jgi:uncharacterized Zn finger protein (UPF0148 family)